MWPCVGASDASEWWGSRSDVCVGCRVCQAADTAISLRYLHRCAQCFGVSSWRHNFHGVHSKSASLRDLFCFAACRCIYGLSFLQKILGARHAGELRISICGLPFRYVAGAQSGHKERGGPHTQRPTPHVPGTVIGAASHRYPEFHGRCRRDEESSTTLWCLLARFSRLFPPALSGSDVRLKETGGKRRKLVFPERLRGTLRCPQPAA